MHQLTRLFLLFFIALASVNSNAHLLPLGFQSQYKEAPQISNVYVYSVASEAFPEPELIPQGAVGTQNHHSGKAIITTVEIGQANYFVAIMNGLRITNPNTTNGYCLAAQGAFRTCQSGEAAVVFFRTWSISNIASGFFTYEATSTNPPYTKKGLSLRIN